ncbi:MAG: type VI secretion system baseplate subunit TssG [Thermodesulfobacteriota bacterium]
MASPHRRPPVDLTRDLFEHPRSYSFFQAVRLLRLFAGEGARTNDELLFHEVLRVRPLLSLSFPGTDLSNVEEAPPGSIYRYRITATFLGLYGPSSPLPTHYTEDLLDEAGEDKTVTRDFLDIYSNPFFRLFFKGWSRNRWYVKITEEEATEYLERLFCLLGLGSPELQEAVPRSRRMLRYIGLFTQFPRSAMGLATLLTDALDVPSVEVIPNVPRQVRIPADQRCYLGRQATVLGEDCHLGEQIADRMGKIRIRVEGLDEDKFHAVLPQRPLFDEISTLTDVYLNQPLEREIELALKPREAHTAVVGQPHWSLLGYDTWLFSHEQWEDRAAVTFTLKPISETWSRKGGEHHDYR